jgi:hypothetical protein
VILGGIENLNRTVGEIAAALQRVSITAEGTHAKTTARLDDIHTWRTETDRRLREDLERRIRDLEATRSQAVALAAVMSLLVGVIAATLARVLVR